MIKLAYISIFLLSTLLSEKEEKILMDKTIVEVEKEVITLLDLDAHLRIQIVLTEGPESLFKISDAGFINVMINLMINRELVSLEMKKEKKYQPNLYNKEAENLYVKFRAKFKTGSDYESFLNNINMSEGELKRILSIYLMIDDYINKLAEEKSKVEEDELTKYMQENGVNTTADNETRNQYRIKLKTDKKKNYAAQYLEELKKRYRIRYLYTPQ